MMGKQTRNSQKVTSPRKTDQIAMNVIEYTRAPKWTKSFYTHKFRDREQIPSRKVTKYMKIGTNFPSDQQNFLPKRKETNFSSSKT